MNYLNYYKYYHLINHLVKKCFVLKDMIMKLYKESKVEFDDEVASSNLASMTNVSHKPNRLGNTIKFRSFEPVL